VIRLTDTRGSPDIPGFGTFGQTAMPWHDRGALQPPGMQLLVHAGGAGSYHAWVGFDMKQHRGVVVLTTDNQLSGEAVGWTLLQHRPLTAQSAHEFEHELIGIGVALEIDKSTQALRITRVYANSPAAKAGMAAGDVIEKVADTPLAGKPLAECLTLIRGPAGSRLQLALVAANGATRSVELTRQKFLLTQ